MPTPRQLPSELVNPCELVIEAIDENRWTKADPQILRHSGKVPEDTLAAASTQWHGGLQ